MLPYWRSRDFSGPHRTQCISGQFANSNQEPTLDGIHSRHLGLYLAEIDHLLNMQERINKLIQASRNLDKCQPLVDIEQELPEILGRGVQEQYIIVRIPDTESFNLGACGEVPSSLWPR